MSDKNKHHNDGEQDRSKGKDYSPPHDSIDFVSNILDPFAPSGKIVQDHEDNEQYRKGWENNEKQEDQKSGGCFLTTACVEHMGLRDDCHELTTLRRFRDTYLITRADTRSLVAQYYCAAPDLVARISASPRAGELFADIFNRLQRIVQVVDEGHPEEAVTLYQAMFNKLSQEFER
jgi:hypothetical protein